jgi:hypothetical protein
MRRLSLILLLGFLALSSLSCVESDNRTSGAAANTPASHRARSRDEGSRRSLRKFGREWRDRYCEKSLQRRYNLSKRQFEAAKKEMKRKDPSLTTKATRNPSRRMMTVIEE